MIVDALKTEGTLRSFLDLPRFIYRDDRNYIKESASKTRASLLRERFLDRQKALSWQSSGRVLARTVARVSPALRDANGGPVGMLGFFEAEDAPEEVARLLSAGIEWLHDQGVRTIVGPIDGDTWHRYRFNVGPFDRPPFLMEPYNKPYYGGLWERAGFEPLESYYSMVVDDAHAAGDSLAMIHRRVLDRGYRLRPLEVARFDREMEVIYRLSTAIFAENFLYEDISLDDFLAMYRPFRALIDPELVWIAETAEGEPVGFLFAVIDYYAAAAAMRGGDGLLARLRFLMNRRRADAVNMKSLGVLAGHRRSGLGAALACECYYTILRKGFRRANLCLIREGNPSGRLDGGRGAVSRRYVLYQYRDGV